MAARRTLIRDHHDEHADDRQNGGDELGHGLLQRLRDVVDVVGHSAQHVPARVVVEVLERQAGELLVRRLPQAVDRALSYACHDELLQPAEESARQIDADEQQQRALESREVDTLAGMQVHAREHVGQCALAPGPQRGDGLLLRDAGGQSLAHHAVEEDVGRRAQDPRTEDGERHADHGQKHHQHDAGALGPQHAHEPLHRAAEVLRLGRRHDQHVAAGAAGAGAHRSSRTDDRSSAVAARPGHAGWSGRTALTAAGPARAALRLPAHATSSAPSCEATISR